MLGAASSKMPYAHQVASNVHKAGLLGLTKTLAGELATEGVRVNCVAPGRTLTPLCTNRAAKLASEHGFAAESVLEEFSRDIPMQRFGRPAEAAGMVVLLPPPPPPFVQGPAAD